MLLASLIIAPALAQASTWEIDGSHSAVHFKVRHLMVSDVRGQFSGLTGTLELGDKDLTQSKVTATVDVATVNTREPKRDEHLKAPDFFDVAKFPTMTFKSKKFVSKGEGKFDVVGDLTLHGVTKEVTLATEMGSTESKDLYGNVHRGATATTTINRTDFGLKWNKALETGGVLVGEEVKIELDLSFVKKAAKKA
jgi:polyisoprenoid-binding protein YceI